MIAALAFGALFALAWVLWLPAVWQLRRASDGRRRIWEVHHFHVGLGLVVLGYLRRAPALVWLGLSLMLDDGGMHWCQWRYGVRSEVEGGPCWPWHFLFRHLLYNPACGLTAWLGAVLFDRTVAK